MMKMLEGMKKEWDSYKIRKKKLGNIKNENYFLKPKYKKQHLKTEDSHKKLPI